MNKRACWIIDAVAFDSYHDELAAAIVRNGNQVVSVRRPPPPYTWDDVNQAYRKSWPRGACVVTHGDLDLVRRVQRDQLWKPGSFANLEQLYCSRYYPYFGKLLLNSDFTILPFAELPQQQDFLFNKYAREGKLFVRPDSPLKLFAGLTISHSSFDADYEFMGFNDFPTSSLVIVSSPKAIEAEWRFVVANQQVVAGTLYRKGQLWVAESVCCENALAYAKHVVNRVAFAPDPVWILDICQLEDSSFFVLEIGGFSCASLYGCNKDDVVRAVSIVAEKIWCESRK